MDNTLQTPTQKEPLNLGYLVKEILVKRMIKMPVYAIPILGDIIYSRDCNNLIDRVHDNLTHWTERPSIFDDINSIHKLGLFIIKYECLYYIFKDYIN